MIAVFLQGTGDASKLLPIFSLYMIAPLEPLIRYIFPTTSPMRMTKAPPLTTYPMGDDQEYADNSVLHITLPDALSNAVSTPVFPGLCCTKEVNTIVEHMPLPSNGVPSIPPFKICLSMLKEWHAMEYF